MKKVDLMPFEFDASGVFGRASNVILPKNISEVKDAVKRNSRICIRGAGTGLAGGAIPQDDVVLDLSKLNHIGKFDEDRKTIEIEAGVILDDLQFYLEKYNLEFPIKPSSHDVCTIGGMISTDAVGGRAIKYGRTSKWVRWIEIVNDKGILSRKGATEISDYSGMEGITGVIVKACLNLSEKVVRSGGLISLMTLDDVISTTKKLKMKNNISMIEIVSPFVSKGIGLKEKYNIIVEYEDDSGILKGTEFDRLLEKRDNIYPFLAGENFTRIEDPKMTIDRIKNLMIWLELKEIPYFGHLSVGILHPCFSRDKEKLIKDMMKLVKRYGGQISGEHGIGLLKKEFVDPQDKKILTNIKKRTDKSNKFNRGKVLDLE